MTADRLLAAVPSGQRRDLWGELLRTFVEARVHDLAAEAAKRRVPAADQAYTALRDATPRPTDQDLAQGPATDRMLADTVAATAAGRELSAFAADLAKHIEDLAGRAMPLERLRVHKDSELSTASSRLAVRVAQADRIAARIDAYPDRAALLAAIDPAFRETLTSGHALLADTGRACADADRALRAGLDGTLADQEAAITAAFDAVTPTVTAVADELTFQLTAVAEAAIGYICAPPPPDPVPPEFARFVTTYREGRQAVLLAPTAAAKIASWRHFDPGHGGELPLSALENAFGTDIPAQLLADALTHIARQVPNAPLDYEEAVSSIRKWAEEHNAPRR
ncbi:hypothetical protein [Yinghuangia seranimata]|uniref:hypothetical protein n=1 Tax=Yinghuangia seranimata TaxID=408067 RepID=UPI00248BB2DA|nr:hypothetical protein [Yinghuangia seranimata]MDI2125515.1 hypothetical protein [Yinghuangia seranimata]